MPLSEPSTTGPFASPQAGESPRVADVRRRLNAAFVASAAPSEKARAKLERQGKIYVRDRIEQLFDEGSFAEDGRYANSREEGLPADGVVTGRGTVDGRPAIVIANDPTVKAGSWGKRTVEKIIRATEMALREEPLNVLSGAVETVEHAVAGLATTSANEVGDRLQRMLEELRYRTGTVAQARAALDEIEVAEHAESHQPPPTSESPAMTDPPITPDPDATPGSMPGSSPG